MKRTILAMVGALALFGCGGGGGNGGGGSSSSDARVAYVNGSPDAGTLRFRRNGTTVASSVAFASASGFKSTDAESADFSVGASGSDVDAWSEAGAPAADADSLVLGLGLLNPPSDSSVPPVTELDKRLAITFGTVDRTAPTGSRARLVIVNGFVRQAGFDTPAIDFRTTDTPTTVNVTNVAFRGVQPTDVDSGTLNVQVRQTNTEQVFVPATPLTLEGGKVYVALISGVEGGTGDAAPSIRLIPIPTRD